MNVWHVLIYLVLLASCYQLIHFVFPIGVFTLCFLALLDFVSRATSVVRPLTRVFQKTLHGSSQILWKATHPPYVKNFFSFFNCLFSFFFAIFFSFSLTADPIGVKISKRCFSHNSDPISPKLYDKYDSQGGIYAITFWQSAKK